MVYGNRDQADVDARWQKTRSGIVQTFSSYAGYQDPSLQKGLVVSPDLPALEPVRLQAKTAQGAVQPVPLDVFFRWSHSDDGGLKPAILFLHGIGASKNMAGLGALAYDIWWVRHCPDELVVIIPQCPDGVKFPWVTSAVKASCLTAVEYAIARGVDPSRVYVAGYSMGSFAAWDFAMDSAEGSAPFAASVPVSGYPLDKERLSILADFPLWSFHAANDQRNRIDEDDEAIEAIAQVSACCDGPDAILRYTRYDWSPNPLGDPDNVGHGTVEQAFDDPELFSWLLKQSRDDQAGRAARYRSRSPSPQRYPNLPGRMSQQETDKRWIGHRGQITQLIAEQDKRDLVEAGELELMVRGQLPIMPRRFTAKNVRNSNTQPETLDFFVHSPQLPDRSELFRSGRPALLYLHGASASKNQGGLRGLAYHCWWLHICPQELVVIIPHSPSRKKHYWLEPAVTATVIHALEELVNEYDVDPYRLYVSGYSTGGTASWEYAVRSAKGKMPFAAAVPVSPSIFSPQNGDVLADYPMWLFTARDSTDKLTADAIDKVMSAGANKGQVATLRHTKYDWSPSAHDVEGSSSGDGAIEQAFGEPEMWRWLLAQKNNRHF